MKLTRMALSVCLCLSAICLMLAVGSLVSLRRAIVDTEAVRADAEAVLNELNTYKEQLPSIPTDKNEDVIVDASRVVFGLRSIGDRIGVYADGYLLATLDISVSTLPPADRSALSAGISASSAEELVGFIQDFSE